MGKKQGPFLAFFGANSHAAALGNGRRRSWDRKKKKNIPETSPPPKERRNVTD